MYINIKIVDNHNYVFIDGEDYIFENSEENSKVTLNFKGYSRIDGHPIFEIIDTNLLTSPLSECSYNNSDIINLYIITNLSDHIPKYDITGSILYHSRVNGNKVLIEEYGMVSANRIILNKPKWTKLEEIKFKSW